MDQEGPCEALMKGHCRRDTENSEEAYISFIHLVCVVIY